MTADAAVSLGLEAAPHWAIAVLVGGDGSILQRFDAAASPAALLAAVAAARRPVTHAGVTCAEADAAVGASAIADLRRVFPSARVDGEPLPSGAALALGEATCGAARGARHVAAFAIADHPVAGLVIDGRVWRGAHSLAGSVAWLALNPVEREDYRRTGCLEAEAGPGGIVRRLVWRVKSGDASRVSDRVGGEYARIGVADVLTGARDGDGVAISVVRDTIKYLGMAVANLATLVDPEIVVLGGLIESDADLLLDPIRQECARRMPAALTAQLRIAVSALGPHGAAVGAAVHAASA